MTELTDPELVAQVSLAPVTRHEFATLAAQTSLALRTLKLAVSSIPLNNIEAFRQHLNESEEAINNIWAVFETYKDEFEKALKGEGGE